MSKTLVIIDVSSIFFRSFFGVKNNLTNSKGIPTNAIYGCLNYLISIINRLKPTHLIIAYDNSRNSIRKIIYPEYKANRSKPPEELILQFPYMKRMVYTLGICKSEKEGFEADDIIASVIYSFKDKFDKIFITSTDKDLMVLVNDENKIQQYDFSKSIFYNEKRVENKFGVKSSQISDYLAITGDSSDNVKGCMGIGPKGAERLLNRYTDVQDIINNVSELKNTVKDKINKSKDDIILSKKLTTLRYGINLNLTIDDLKFNPTIGDKFKRFISDMEFNDIYNRMYTAITKLKRGI